MFSQILAAEPELKTADEYIGRAKSFETAGDTGRAIADYTRAIEADPKALLAYYKRGNLFLGKGELDKAIIDYSRLIETDPAYKFHYIIRTMLYIRKGDYDSALADCNKAAEITPAVSATAVFSLLREIYAKKGDYSSALADYNRAIAYYNKAIDDYPGITDSIWNAAMFYSNRCYLYKEMGRDDMAIADCTRAIEIETAPVPKEASADYYNLRAELYTKAADYDKAIDDLTRVIGINKDSITAYVNRAVLYDKKGEHARAAADYIEAALLGDKASINHLASIGCKLPDILPEAVFAGDSLTLNAPWAVMFPGMRTRNMGIGGGTTETVLTGLNRIIALRPKKIFIMAGINDLCLTNRTISAIIGNYQKILNTLSSNLSGTKIYVQSILPIIDGDFPRHTAVNLKIAETNNQLKQLLARLNNTNITYVDLHKDFLETSGNHLRDTLTYDGVHLNKSGYELWKDKIKGYVRN